MKICMEFFKDTCEEAYSSVKLQTFGLELEIILKLLPMNSFTGTFMKFC